ncbi:uncharacterized protein BT62DRAFT_172808 [Guyanagaster necrorhizus]|uniref:MYND-type domain-containing protein n=1 Tax=Guyanagaster necrorhizus TaxID=856835 RepID=A0A9P8AS18_9AGAR|nr:uncharacterized protein BT62DRAFT_172808 [Guyanagaster necrorhizus MCA 3950]KAG7445670.1 hypothetical protein BT62DRAFT_172808 [Guyanagaster necrorhizus MCA 3950]
MPHRKQYYSLFSPPSLSMTELVKTTLDHDSTDMLIDKWLEHRGSNHDAYHDWFREVRERKHAHSQNKQAIVWSKGEFVPENIFCRTVDTGRLIPLDRTWTTHVYHHRSMQERKLSMMPVVFTMLPELMILRGMHDTGCDEIFIIVTDLKRQEMDDVTEYFKLVCRQAFGRTCKPSMERKIQYEHMRITHTLVRQRRNPCFPQIDLTLRAILYEKRPRFIVLFSHQTTSYSQILFTHASFVPDEEIFYDYPTGCPNPCCTEDCEMIRFPRRGLETASVLEIKRGGKFGRRIRARQMCNWIECDVCFDEEPASISTGSSEGSESSVEARDHKVVGQTCSKCKLVKYCCLEHQKKDWEEHRRVCVKMT